MESESRITKQNDPSVSILLDMKKLQCKDTDYLFDKEIIKAQFEEKKLLETYLIEQKLGVWSDTEFSMDNNEIGPELLLNGKYLDIYRYPNHLPYLYHNLTEIMMRNMTWQGVFELEEEINTEVE